MLKCLARFPSSRRTSVFLSALIPPGPLETSRQGEFWRSFKSSSGAVSDPPYRNRLGSYKDEEGSLRNLDYFKEHYPPYPEQPKQKSKEELDFSGDESEEIVDNSVPTAIFRKKKRLTGSVPKLYKHMFPPSEFHYLGTIDVGHLPEDVRMVIPLLEEIFVKRSNRSPTWVSRLWTFLEEDPKEALTRTRQLHAMLPTGVTFVKFFKHFPQIIFDDNLEYLHMGEACIALMEKRHHFRLGYKYGIYDNDDMLEVYRKGKRMYEAWEILHFDHGWTKKQFLEAVEFTTITFLKFPESVNRLSGEQICEILPDPQRVENRIRRFAQVFRNFINKKHFFTYYWYIVRSEDDRFDKFLDLFQSLNPVRVQVGGVTSHQIEGMFEAYDALKAEYQMAWSMFMEELQLALADPNQGPLLMLDFKDSRETGKRRKLRKRLLEYLLQKVYGVAPKKETARDSRRD
ncbi:hypothetical protein BSKO_05441 [Bryopsis sp. KO-2023]|nr:hypothetical protein BSKO_05441 [Bryopsis sp. KO-2023]